MNSGMDRTVTVLVTAIGGGGHGEQIVKALRRAPHTRYRIIGGDASPDCPQFALVDQPVVMPKASESAYIEAVLALCKQFSVSAVFHGCEPELHALNDARTQFHDSGVFLPINPKSVIDICTNKERTAEFLAAHGFGHPPTQRLQREGDINGSIRYPVVVKPVSGGGSRDCYIAQNRIELEMLRGYLRAGDVDYVVQEYVGTSDDEFTVGVLHDMDGNYINSIAVRRKLEGSLNVRTAVRNRTRRSELGEWLVISSGVSHGEIGRFPEVTERCENIAKALDARGVINIQCRFVNTDIQVFEINPRFSGTTSLRAIMGYNEPDALVRHHVLGENIEVRFGYREGWISRSLQETVLSKVPPPSWDSLVAPKYSWSQFE